MIEGLTFTEVVDVYGYLDLNLSDKALKPCFPLKLCLHFIHPVTPVPPAQNISNIKTDM